jgi:uncharacterized membrane protein YdfJ with MMPL/SSD domain
MRFLHRSRIAIAPIALAGLTILGLATFPLANAQERKPQDQKVLQAPKTDPAVVAARQQALMLDDLYKTAVVLITKHYVNKETDLAAATAAKALFAAMKEKGHHDVRLIDATGAPYNDENIAQDKFEEQALEQLKKGKATYEQVEKRDDGRYFRFATAVPVVMEKCVMCHESYKDVKEGEAIGALTYTIKIQP